MATTTDKVITVLELRDGDFNARTRATEAMWTRAKGREAAAAEASERRITAASGRIRGLLLASAATIAAGFSVQAVTNMADSYTRFTNQLKLAGLEGIRLSDTQDALFASAQRYGVELEGLGTLYGRVAQAGRELGASNEDLLKFTNGVAAAIKVQGATTESVRGALLQLSQALGGTNVRAEEYNSINEGARPILTAVANGSDRFKGSVNALRAAVIAGTVTSREFYEAFLKGSAGLEEQATRANLTVGQSLTILNNALGKYIGETDKALSATDRIGAAISALANNLGTVIPVIGVLIGLFGARYVGSVASAALATRAAAAAAREGAAASMFRASALAAEAAAQAQVTPFTNAATLALLRQNAAIAANTARLVPAASAASRFGAGLLALAGGPISVAIIAVAALAAGLLYLNNKYGESAVMQRELAASSTRTEKAIDAYREAATKAATATGVHAAAARANAEAMRIEALAAVRSAEALRIRRLALLAERVVAKENALADLQGRGPNGRLVGRQIDMASGQVFAAQGGVNSAQRAYDEAEAEATAAAKALRDLEADIRDGSLAPIPVAPVDTTTRRGRRDTGPTEAEKAAMREVIDLQQQADLARARGDEVAERAATRRLDILAKIEEYDRAGVENAEARATADVDAIYAAEEASRQVDRYLEEADRRNERRAETRAREEAAMDRQLQTQLELARIEGNEGLIRILERELALRQAIAQLGENATPDEIAAVRGDQSMLNEADDRQLIRDEAATMASDFVSVLRSEDIGEELGRRFQAAAFDGLEDILTDVFAAIMGAPGGGAGGGLGSAIGSAIMGLFGGGRALGGPVKAGRIYKVNENTPRSENFIPSVSGYIRPADSRPTRQAAQQSVTNMSFKADYHLEGAAGTEAILGAVSRMQAASERRMLAAARAGAPAAMLQRRLLQE